MAGVTQGSLRFMLLVDTCGDPGRVALLDLLPEEDGQAAVRAERRLPGRETQERLLPAIADVLAEARLSVGDLQGIAVVTGPGSFTGIRVGMAAAKGLAEALHVPMVIVSRLAVLAQVVPGPVAEAWLQAGRGDIFRGRYAPSGCLEETMLPASDALAELPDSGAVVVEPELLALSPRLRLLSSPSAAEVLPLIMQTVRSGEFADAAMCDANYLRVPDAELARLRAAGRDA